jgi:peroxisome proliferator-activated receptor gamma coactivator-related protein 1
LISEYFIIVLLNYSNGVSSRPVQQSLLKCNAAKTVQIVTETGIDLKTEKVEGGDSEKIGGTDCEKIGDSNGGGQVLVKLERRSRRRDDSYSSSSEDEDCRSRSKRRRSRSPRMRSRRRSGSRERRRSRNDRSRSSGRRHRRTSRSYRSKGHPSSWSRERRGEEQPYDKERERREQERRHRVQERQRQVEERRVVYVGKIQEGTLKDDLRKRFQVFGPIVDISVHFRDFGDNYGFVTFQYKVDAYAAVEHGNDDKSQPQYDLCFGGRRAFCKERYLDLDDVEDTVASKGAKLGFDELLEHARGSSVTA